MHHPKNGQDINDTALPRNFYNNYTAITQQPDKIHLINSFDQISWKDPFPDKKSNFCPPVFINDFVYDEKRMVEGQVPFMIFMPKKEVMFKLMRACIGVKDQWEIKL